MPPRKKTIAAVAKTETETEAVTVTATESEPITVTATVIATSTESEPTQDNIIAPEPVKKAKREKKTTKHKVVAVITSDGIQGSFQAESRRPLIAHLPVHSNEIQFHDQPFVYDPNPPSSFEAFNVAEIDPFAEEGTYEPAPKKDVEEFSGLEEINRRDESNTVVKKVEQSTSYAPQTHLRKEYGPSTLLVQFSNTKHTHELPSKTDLACFWCCDTFEGRPCVIPTRIVDDTWHVYGCFCTPQCCMAYLLSELIDTHTRWERIALLNRLYGMNTNGRIYPAPSRESLQRFGGPISIQDFRGMCDAQRVRVDIHMPPMVSILSSMDTKPIDFYETTMRNSLTSPYQCAPVKSADEPATLKLKRNKPLKDKESTLDACLQIMGKSD